MPKAAASVSTTVPSASRSAVCTVYRAGEVSLHSAARSATRKTEGLKLALNKYGFDGLIAGIRRDEEATRAKERVFSCRGPGHTWEPRRQRPELWNLYNTRLAPGETMRVFPLSNWTELDVWDYIEAEQIPVFTAWRRPDAYPNDHPLYLGWAGLRSPQSPVARLLEADAILAGH